MKKCVSLILILVLLAGCAGCGRKGVDHDKVEPDQKGLYDSTHILEQQTGGAVRAYPLQENDYVKVVMMGSKVLLLTEGGAATVLHGENGVVSANGIVEGYQPSASSFAVGVNGVASYVAQSREVILLNPQLQQTNRIELPEGIQGEPVISLESNEIFYGRAGEIRALNMETGIARLIKSHVVKDQSLTGCYFGGKVIRCQVKDQNDTQRQIYLSAENGITLSEDANVSVLETYEDRHFAQRKDGGINQTIVGTMTGESKQLALTSKDADAVFQALALNGAVSYKTDDNGVIISFHDLAVGQTTAQVTLPGGKAPVSITADSSCVWILTEEAVETQEEQPETQYRQVLLRWDISKSALAEPVSVITTLYTASSPDTEGLKASAKLAEDLNEKYGVRISVWEEAVENTGDYTAVAEHQPEALNEMMEKLEPAMQVYPDSFLRKTIKSGWIRINLVRSIASGEDWVQFWDDGDCYLLISAQADPAKAFLETVGHGVDSRVLGNSREYDTWSQLNPEGFLYTSEADGQNQDVAAYLEGENRAFVNIQSIASPNEDRRQIFMAAMNDGNESVFASTTMQAKLRRMCEGIREAYDLENKKELFKWEQYLTEPMIQIEETNG